MTGKNGKPRVLQIGKFYAPFFGGMETHLQDLCAHLKSTVDLKVIVANQGRHKENVTLDDVEVSRLGTMFELSGAPVCPSMSREIRETQADLVHLHHPNPTALLAYLKSGSTQQLIVTYHSDIIRQRVLGKAFSPILHRVLEKCAAIIATSPDYVESSPVLARHRERCRIIPHGIPVARFQDYDRNAVAEIRKEHGSRIVLGVGRLIYYKGFQHLVRAMTSVDAKLLIVGDGPLRPTLERETVERGLQNRVVFIGRVDNVLPYYHACDVFVLPSIARSEAFGIVQLEAMACGKPVVNTRLASGVPYVSLDGLTGITVPPASSASLARAINTLLENDELRAEYGEAARRRVFEEFSIELMARRTIELYGEVMGAPIASLSCFTQASQGV